jgi:hypothetical protein
MGAEADGRADDAVPGHVGRNKRDTPS